MYRLRAGLGPSAGLRNRGSPAVRSVSLPAVSQPNPSNWWLVVSHGNGNFGGMPAFALKGQNEIAQGNALGKWHNKTPSPERAKGFGS